MKTIRFCILFLILPFFSSSQELLPTPEVKKITEFPFKQYSGGVMIIKALFDNISDSLNFILDTGSSGISLDSSTCEEFGLFGKQTDTSVTGIAGIKKVKYLFNKTLHLPGLAVNDMQFHIYDYSLLTSVYGEKIDGVIGYSFFNRYIVKINFDKALIEIFSPGKIKYPQGGTTLHPEINFLPLHSALLKDNRRLIFDFFLDTGAGLSLLLSDKFTEDSSVLSSKRKQFITQAEGLGGKKQMRLTVIKELKLGPYKFRLVPAYLFKDNFNVTSYPYSGGLIGNEILRRFNLILNYPQREIHLLPNSHFSEPFEYGYSGFSIYNIDGKIMVEDVVVGSPSDKAGIKTGDEIIGVENNFSGNIQQFKNILQEPNKKIKIFINRQGNLIDLQMTTTSIL
jgi:hypothetical protein